MREDPVKARLPTHGDAIDPVAMARRDQMRALPKRFYKAASAEWRNGAFVLCLDGKPARTPGRNVLALPSQDAGDAIAAEWAAQSETISPASMPMTRIANSALDGVAREISAVQGEIVKYAATDLLYYRAGEPAALLDTQAAVWDPVLQRIGAELGVAFEVTRDFAFKPQSPSALNAVERAVAAVRMPLPLAGLQVMTSLTGSALIALAIARDWIGVEAGWAAAHVDEDFQIRAWGADAQAQSRRQLRWADMLAAARLFAMTR